MRLAIDIDDVVGRFVDQALWVWEKQQGGTKAATKEHITTWESIAKVLGMTGPEWVEWLDANAQDIYQGMWPLAGSQESVNTLKSEGHTSVFVTSRKPLYGSWTNNWLELFGFPIDELHFTNDKASVEADVYVEDAPHHLEAIKARRPDVLLIRFKQPWNVGSPGEPYDSWPAIEERIREYAGEHLTAKISEFKIVTDERVAPGTAYLMPSGEAFEELVERTMEENRPILEALQRSEQGEVRITSATGGQKGTKPAQLGAIDPLALKVLAEVAGFGAAKYDAFNYVKGYDWSLSYNAMQRHALAFWDGEDLDDESGLPHAAHVAWHGLALTTFLLRQRGTDDRISAMLAGLEEAA